MPNVVSCLLQLGDKILLLRRSQAVGTYKGLWGGITGFIESGETPLKTAYKEILEETGIDAVQVQLKCSLEPISFTDSYRGKIYEWVVFPFVFMVESSQIIRIDWEHVDYKWIDPVDVDMYRTVPMLKEIIKKVFQ